MNKKQNGKNTAIWGPDEWPAETFFCISVSKDGKTVKQDGKHYKEFKELVDSAAISWVNCCIDDVADNIENIARHFGFGKELARDLLTHKSSAYVDMGSELGLLLPAVKVRNLLVHVSPIYLLIRKNLVLSVHSRRVTRWINFFNYAETFMRKIPPNALFNDKITMILIRLLGKNDEKNFENLRIIEEEGDKINRMLINSDSPRIKLGDEIYRMKHALISYLGALWASMDVVNSLRYGDSELVTDDPVLLKEIGVIAGDLTNHLSLAEHMSEVLASGLEVLQSIYNNQLQVLNNKLSLTITWLTVLGTAVLVPNTLATIYGIPAISEHANWQDIMVILAASTIISAVAAYLIIKRMLPKKVE
ncbi:MAG: CorA family divalent cation transporter [Candidatus Diapherotrites archaeon]|nr:CorA family divalent cation transporter [Candidatus Diapherotrites archaeon]